VKFLLLVKNCVVFEPRTMKLGNITTSEFDSCWKCFVTYVRTNWKGIVFINSKNESEQASNNTVSNLFH